jgi:hypothetical protein
MYIYIYIYIYICVHTLFCRVNYKPDSYFQPSLRISLYSNNSHNLLRTSLYLLNYQRRNQEETVTHAVAPSWMQQKLYKVQPPCSPFAPASAHTVAHHVRAYRVYEYFYNRSSTNWYLVNLIV